MGQPVVREFPSPTGEHLHGVIVEVDAAAAGTGLDRKLEGLTGDALQGANDREATVRAVEVGPFEPADLTSCRMPV
jgi:hypothetical protein